MLCIAFVTADPVLQEPLFVFMNPGNDLVDPVASFLFNGICPDRELVVSTLCLLRIIEEEPTQ
jgi:hypothetical protein